MQPYETQATIGPTGELNLENVPFAPGQAVRVQVQVDEPAEVPTGFVFGLHAGMMEMSPDFDDPLPDSFWLGKDADETAA